MEKFLVLCFLIVSGSAQAPQDPIADFCRRYGHQTAVIDRKLYIDGGWLYANPIVQNPVPTINQNLLYGDLDSMNEYNFPTVHANLSKNSSIPDVSGGILWADRVNKVFWLYGGEYATAPSTFQLWGYDVVLNQWNTSTAGSDASSMIQRVSYGAGCTAHELGNGYYYGGYLNKFTNPLWTGAQYATSSLIVFDMDSNTITNKTGPVDNIGRAEGVMVSIPASASGMLVYFGGVKFPYQNVTEVPQPMDTIMLYDIADEKWYTQKTTGDIPGNRRKFCGGVTYADDKSSYNIYLYGGFGFGENITGFDDVYILTLPTFQWIKWYPEPGASTRPHGLLSCDVIEYSQMIVMGGNFTEDTDCDATNVMGMHNLNLGQNDATDAKWYQFLPNLTSYIVPPAIISAVGGSPSGGATKLAPAGGWSDPALQVYFNEQAQFQARTPTRSLPASTDTSTSSSDSSKKPNIGIIVGAAVGGSVVIIVIVLAICWYCRRNRKAPAKQEPNPPINGPRELSGASPYNEKDQTSTQIIGSPRSPHSPIPSTSYSNTTIVPQTISPGFAYPPNYPPHDGVYQQYHTSAQYTQTPYQGYHPTYGYMQYPVADTASPPEGWIPHNQQYFPPPDVRRTSPAHEMPTVMTPHPFSGPNQTSPTYNTSNEQVVHQPAPIRDRRNVSTPAHRRGMSAGSPTDTTTTYTSETGSRLSDRPVR